MGFVFIYVASDDVLIVGDFVPICFHYRRIRGITLGICIHVRGNRERSYNKSCSAYFIHRPCKRGRVDILR